jgi:3D (Asp-Asp-Asp) domain-containing protein
VVPAGQNPGVNTVVVTDGANIATAAFTFLSRTISLTPTSGDVGSSVTIQGSGFTDNGYIPVGSITLGGRPWNTAVVTIKSTGQFKVILAVPLNANPGVNQVVVTDSAAVQVVANFVVNSPCLTMSPVEAPLGTVVTITGAHFGVGDIIPSGGITFAGIGWNSKSIRIHSSGGWSVSLPLPANAPTGWNLVTVSTVGGTIVPSLSFHVISVTFIGQYQVSAYAYPEEADTAHFGKFNSTRVNITVEKQDGTSISVSVKTLFCDAMKMNGGGLVNANPQNYVHLVQWTLVGNIFREIDEVTGSQGWGLVAYQSIAKCPTDTKILYGDTGFFVAVKGSNTTYNLLVADTCPYCCTRGNGFDFWLGIGKAAYSAALNWGVKTVDVYVYR